MKLKLLLCGLFSLTISIFAKPAAGEQFSALRNAVILVIRHAEKQDNGRNLSTAGELRARAYVNYFKSLTVDGKSLKPDYLFAAADSKGSRRPRLTVEPTSKALGVSIDSRFKNKEFQRLAHEIQSKPHGRCILICWHHGEIPHLLQALGTDSGQLFPDNKWPESVFNWVIEMSFDSDGGLVETKLIKESF